jgi:molecular chaperone DnaK
VSNTGKQTSPQTPVKYISLNVPYVKAQDFIIHYARYIHNYNFIFPKANMFAVGTNIRLRVRLKNGTQVFNAQGQIVPPKQDQEGMTVLRLKAFDKVSKACYYYMQEYRKKISQSEFSSQEAMKRAIRGMTLISDGVSEFSAHKTNPGVNQEGPVIGIDLGTTNSCCGVVKNNRPLVIPSRRGHNTIPSVVALDSMGQVVVGHGAKAQMELNPSKTIYGSKRLVGRPFGSPVVRRSQDRFQYEIIEGDDSLAAVKIEQRVFSLEEVSGLILEEIKNVAQEYMGQEIHRAVITVPAFYNENQRVAVRKAGKLAGLHVERILNEPTAAALAYGYNRGKEQRILVYDLGGGTFDASILDIFENTYQVMATGGDTFLGGVDFDSTAMDHVLIEFQLQLGKAPDIERVALLRALQGAEFAKCNLSESNDTQIRLPFIGFVDDQPVDLEVSLSRSKLEELVKPLITRTLDVCEEVMQQSGTKKQELDAILLVGGMSRMPLIWKMIEERFGIEPHKGVHPDESVALGAALLADSLGKIDSILLIDVLPMSIVVGLPGGEVKTVLPSGITVPASKTYAIKTYLDNQTEMELPIFQGQSRKIDDNEYLGTTKIKGIPPGPAGSRTIEITFSIDSECLLTVHAKDSQAGKLAENAMTTRESMAALRKKYRESGEGSLGPMSAADFGADRMSIDDSDRITAALGIQKKSASGKKKKNTELSSDEISQAYPSKGLWGFIKRLFGKR